MKKLAVIGKPIKHSKSPQIHRQWIKQYQLDLDYEAIEVHHLGDFIQKFRNDDHFLGFNVTVPYKEKILDYLDEIDLASEKIAAVNTVLQKEGRLYGFNTDIFGIEESLRELIPKVKTCLLIGAGGAARALAFFLSEKGIGTEIRNRNADRGKKLAHEFSHCFSEQPRNKHYDLIINATSCGLKKDELAFDMKKESVRANYLFDLIYEPEETAFLKQGKKLACQPLNGKKMLLTQAQKSFEIWTGVFPKSDEFL